jgi:hypothetical protein
MRPLFAAIALLVATVPASAHPAPFSYLDVVFRNGNIDGTLVVHVIDVAHDLGIQPPERLLDDALVQSERARIGNILQPRILLRADRRLTLSWESIEVLKEDLALRLKYRIVLDEQPGRSSTSTRRASSGSR